MYLSDIAMAIYSRVEGRLRQDLTGIKFDAIIEDETLDSIRDAATELGVADYDVFSVRSDAPEGSGEKAAFNILSNSVLGQVVQRMLTEFSIGKNIYQIDHDGDLYFWVA